ncbi:ENHANCER OF AG-4 protein 2, partial [Sesamum angolense]
GKSDGNWRGMAPGRKRGAKGVKTKNELSLGDLVLAKVKGFPAWPAKISRPEDWERVPDLKSTLSSSLGHQRYSRWRIGWSLSNKYQFDVYDKLRAFVAPADIQAFTIEAKNKLSARCQGKTVKYFAQAVKEICEEFEELQLRNLNGVRDKSAQSLVSAAHSLDLVVDEASGVNGNDGSDRKGSNCKLEMKGSTDVSAALERCSQRQGKVECQDVKPCLSDNVNHSLFPHVSSEKRNKLYTNTSDLVMDSVPLSSPSHDSLVNEDGSHEIKVEGRSSDDDHNEVTNGLKTKLAMGSKKKPAGAIRRNSGSAVPHDHTGEMIQRKCASDGSMKVSSAGNSRLGLDIGSERKEKKLLKVKRHSETEDNGREDAEVSFEEHNKALSRKKIKAQHGREKQRFQTNEASSPGKMSKCADTGDGASMVRARTNKKRDSTSPDVLDDKITGIESKRLTSGGKAENRRPLRLQMSTNDPNFSSGEDDLPPIKRRRRVSEAMSSSASISENRLGGSASRQSDMVLPNKIRSPVMQLPTKRRAVRLFDDEDDESPKTPIHGGFTNKVSVIPQVSDSRNKPVMHGESCVYDQGVSRNSGPLDDGLKEKVQSGRMSNKVLSPATQQGTEKRTRELSAAHAIPSPLQDSEKLPSTEAKPVQISPKRSPHSIGGTRPSAELQSKHSSKAPANISQKKTPAGDSRSASASDRSTSFLAQSLGDRSKPALSVDKRKATPKSDLRINDSVVVVGPPNENHTSLGERLDGGKDGKTNILINSKTPDSVMSMKHLIAAAQAKKRQAHLQNSHGNPLLLSFPDADMSARSPSPPPPPPPATLAYESSNTLQLGVQGIHSTSPCADVHQFSSINQHENEELEERRVSSGNQGTGSSLSGGTEAAVARDAFEGMIETLSRTKESIGRATRLAIDCAKYGIANEVVELLIQKLENEPSLHRRVDLFFLVDSITQCSHSQRGIAGASYIPIVQAALPRLIGAAAPAGAGAQENRRQCHKVLRLWLERKILPESVLRRYMGDIGVVNDDASVGLSLRRPSRAERAIDDPIREMEGMVVDEYGSNATFQLPGLLSAHVFDEEEEYEDSFPTKLCQEINDTSPSELAPATSRDPENQSVTPSDRRHCILEDVDGELEMEDVSGHQRDEKPLFTNGTLGLGVLEPNSDGILESAPNSMCAEWLPSPEGSPPLPPGSPPVTPPLPTSPPPFHHHPHHPTSFISTPRPPHPPPPITASSISSTTCWSSSTAYCWAASTIAFPAIISGSASIDVPTYASTSICDITFPSITYPPPSLQHEIGATASGNQCSHVVSNARGSLIDASARSEVLTQQSSCFPPSGVGIAREHVGYNSSRHVDYRQATSVSPYSLQNFPDGPRRYATSEQTQMQVNEFNADCPRGGWMPGGRSCSGPPYSNEGYFGPPRERPPASVVNFQPSAPNNLPSAAQIPGDLSVHGVPMISCRPDMSSGNWRPA